MWVPAPRTPELEPHTTAIGSILWGIYAFTRHVTKRQNTSYCPSVNGCRAVRCAELHSDSWSRLYVVLSKCGGRRTVDVIELVAGEWPEHVARLVDPTWHSIWALAGRLVDRYELCAEFENYDACRLEEIGRIAETIMSLLGGL